MKLFCHAKCLLVILQTTVELYNMKFNEKIKALRKASNMNQQELADKLHIHVTHLSKMENGHLLPSIDIVQRLMKVFAVSADNLGFPRLFYYPIFFNAFCASFLIKGLG